jgi:hypothetical protein
MKHDRASARISVRLTPRSRHDAITSVDSDGTVAVRVTAPPAEGRANEALLRVIARALGVAPSCLRLAAGGSSRRKTVDVAGFDRERALVLLRRASQSLAPHSS